jgi:hypothetical protein
VGGRQVSQTRLHTDFTNSHQYTSLDGFTDPVRTGSQRKWEALFELDEYECQSPLSLVVVVVIVIVIVTVDSLASPSLLQSF